jgi:hypothetical protein
MIIDVFKTDLFNKLKEHNNELVNIFDRVCINRNNKYYYRQDPTQEVSHWFNVYKMNTNPLPKHYPNIIPLNFDPKFCLLENYPNYVSLFLVNLLYDDKDIIIEDVCSGPGKFAFYLSKLGFKNFSLIDNFSQIRPEFLYETMKADGIVYKLNAPLDEIKPIVTNQVSYPAVVRETYPTTELMCMYSIMTERRDFLCKNGYKLLCTDSDDMMICLARADKHDEFTNKLRPFEVI